MEYSPKEIVGLFFRLLIGVPLFTILCLLFVFSVFLAAQPSGPGKFPVPNVFTGVGLAALFAALAYAIWRILLFRRAERAHAHRRSIALPLVVALVVAVPIHDP